MVKAAKNALSSLFTYAAMVAFTTGCLFFANKHWRWVYSDGGDLAVLKMMFFFVVGASLLFKVYSAIGGSNK